jgi:hypothetical protein
VNDLENRSVILMTCDINFSLVNKRRILTIGEERKPGWHTLHIWTACFSEGRCLGGLDRKETGAL